MTRTAAHEHRIAACIAGPLASGIEPIAPLILRNVLPGSGRQATPAASAATVVPLIRGLSSPQATEQIKADTSTITCPALRINDSRDYPQLPGQARAAIADITNTRASLHLFTPPTEATTGNPATSASSV
jgi:hypothetical protein